MKIKHHILYLTLFACIFNLQWILEVCGLSDESIVIVVSSLTSIDGLIQFSSMVIFFLILFLKGMYEQVKIREKEIMRKQIEMEFLEKKMRESGVFAASNNNLLPGE